MSKWRSELELQRKLILDALELFRLGAEKEHERLRDYYNDFKTLNYIPDPANRKVSDLIQISPLITARHNLKALYEALEHLNKVLKQQDPTESGETKPKEDDTDLPDF